MYSCHLCLKKTYKWPQDLKRHDKLVHMSQALLQALPQVLPQVGDIREGKQGTTLDYS